MPPTASRFIFLPAVVLSLMMAVPVAHAGDRSTKGASTVIELFTSQGCSSCPPADSLLGSYARRDDVVALSFNVDYWDYLGWKDTLGKRAYSKRQYTYARNRGDGKVYTPQVVVNGRQHAVGSSRRLVESAIAGSQSKRIGLEVSEQGQTFVIKVAAGKKPRKAATVWIAAVTPSVTVNVKRGENGGQRLTYHNVVRQLMPVGMWSGDETVVRLRRGDLLQSGVERCAVIIQAANTGPILAAAWLPE